MTVDAVSQTIDRVVRERFSDAQIDVVKVRESEDFDGEPVLEITIVFNPAAGERTLDAARMSGLPRHIITHLRKLNVELFPLISYISKTDASKSNIDLAAA